MPKFSVKKPFTVLVAVILVVVLGFVSLAGMQTDLLPNMNLPYLLVVTTYPGASPEQVESDVTRPLGEQPFHPERCEKCDQPEQRKLQPCHSGISGRH